MTLTDLAIQLSRQIKSLLPLSGGQNLEVRTKLNERLESRWMAFENFEDSLKYAPRDLYCIIDGMPPHGSLYSELERFVDVVRGRMRSEDRVFKITILAQKRCSDVFSVLEDDEKILIDSNK